MALTKSAKRREACDAEYGIARALFSRGDLDAAFHHLERAHVLGQPWVIRHTRAHWLMLRIGVKRGDTREIFGQVIRLAGGGLLSWFGRLPDGNTGGANVPAEKPMPLPADLKELCDA